MSSAWMRARSLARQPIQYASIDIHRVQPAFEGLIEHCARSSRSMANTHAEGSAMSEDGVHAGRVPPVYHLQERAVEQ